MSEKLTLKLILTLEISNFLYDDGNEDINLKSVFLQPN
jgi:hypothetical protein